MAVTPSNRGTVNHATFVQTTQARAVNVIVNFNVEVTPNAAVMGVEMNRDEIFSRGFAVVLYRSVWGFQGEGRGYVLESEVLILDREQFPHWEPICWSCRLRADMAVCISI